MCFVSLSDDEFNESKKQSLVSCKKIMLLLFRPSTPLQLLENWNGWPEILDDDWIGTSYSVV
jgi:hypothetical protein